MPSKYSWRGILQPWRPRCHRSSRGSLRLSFRLLMSLQVTSWQKARAAWPKKLKNVTTKVFFLSPVVHLHHWAAQINGAVLKVTRGGATDPGWQQGQSVSKQLIWTQQRNLMDLIALLSEPNTQAGYVCCGDAFMNVSVIVSARASVDSRLHYICHYEPTQPGSTASPLCCVEIKQRGKMADIWNGNLFISAAVTTTAAALTFCWVCHRLTRTDSRAGKEKLRLQHALICVRWHELVLSGGRSRTDLTARFCEWVTCRLRSLLSVTSAESLM